MIGLLIFLPFMLAALVCMGSFILSLYQMVLMGMLTDETADLLVLENIGSLLLMMVILLIGALISGSYQIVAQRNYLFNRATLNGSIKLRSSMQTLPYMGLLITNTLITLFSFGFAVPVAEVRHARYLAGVRRSKAIWRCWISRRIRKPPTARWPKKRCRRWIWAAVSEGRHDPRGRLSVAGAGAREAARLLVNESGEGVTLQRQDEQRYIPWRTSPSLLRWAIFR